MNKRIGVPWEMHAHLDKRLQGRKREILAAIMYAIRPVCGTLAPPPPPSSLADYAWLWMARRGPGSQNRLPLDSMHVRYYTVFSVYLFHARRASAIRNYAWNMCPGTYGSHPARVRSSMDFLPFRFSDGGGGGGSINSYERIIGTWNENVTLIYYIYIIIYNLT